LSNNDSSYVTAASEVSSGLDVPKHAKWPEEFALGYYFIEFNTYRRAFVEKFCEYRGMLISKE
jgi:hypothetical protein